MADRKGGTEYTVLSPPPEHRNLAPMGIVWGRDEFYPALRFYRSLPKRTAAQLCGMYECGCHSVAIFTEEIPHPTIAGLSETYFVGWSRGEACEAHGPTGSNDHVFMPDGDVPSVDVTRRMWIRRAYLPRNPQNWPRVTIDRSARSR